MSRTGSARKHASNPASPRVRHKPTFYLRENVREFVLLYEHYASSKSFASRPSHGHCLTHNSQAMAPATAAERRQALFDDALYLAGLDKDAAIARLNSLGYNNRLQFLTARPSFTSSSVSVVEVDDFFNELRGPDGGTDDNWPAEDAHGKRVLHAALMHAAYSLPAFTAISTSSVASASAPAGAPAAPAERPALPRGS